MKKKIISIFIILVLLIIGASNCYADTEYYMDTENGGYTYKYTTRTNNPTVVITKFHDKGAKNVEIPSHINGKEVSRIGKEAFKDVDSIQTLKIPNTVWYIMDNAFENCSNLEEVVVGDITYDALYDEQLDDIYAFGDFAFKDCSKLKKIVLNKVYGGGSDYIFNGCTNLKSIYGHNGDYMLKDCAKDANLEVKYLVPFKDVNYKNWYYNAVEYTYDNNMISGYSATKFAPYDNLTRGMIVTILWRMEGAPENDGISEFTDVDSTAWYAKAIKWAAENNIVKGYSESTNYGPKNYVTRQDLAVILRNYASYKGENVNANTNLTNYKDSNKISDYANTAMQWAVGKKVITGNAKDKTLNPKGNATRAESSSMIFKFCNNVMQ